MLTNDNIRYIANLARIDIPEAELNQFTHSLENIIQYVNALNEVDVSNVQATSHVLNLKNVYRQDIVKPSLTQSEALKQSIEHAQGSFKVPKVIE